MMPPALGRLYSFERRLLDDAAARGHEQVLVVLEMTHGNDAGDLFLFPQRQHVGDRPAGAGPAHLRNLVDLEPVQLARDW